MPHQCTNCGRGFPDGSKEMLAGCPDCGGNKFQFAPSGTPDDRSASSADRSRADRSRTNAVGGDGSPERGDGSLASSGEREETGAFPEWPETARPPEDRSDGESSSDTADRPGTSGVGSTDESAADGEFEWGPGDEDDAQASARSDVVTPEELPPTPDGPDAEDAPDHGRVVSEPTGEQPSLEELREELNEQFESIKIIQPGQYELNLMELYDREEHIVSLQEDGRYVINVPDSWREADE